MRRGGVGKLLRGGGLEAQVMGLHQRANLLMEIFNHRQTITDLEARIETINAEEARVAAGGNDGNGYGGNVLTPPPPAGNGVNV
ncbi:hypothetical protein LTS15_009329 [Exophiala xenobiotica]|nr:hypothetical protein LTS15_009329 [Exophiala xenobiotica]